MPVYLPACIVMAVLIALVVLHKWAAARELKRLWADIPEVRTFIEIGGIMRAVNDPSDFHFESSQELWTARGGR